MEVWKASAEKQRDDATFDAYPYPDIGKSDRKSAIHGFKDYDEVVKKIEGSGADTIFIVGHSSGCAVADEVNSRVKGEHKNITLIDLDGFAPEPGQIKGSTVQAWSAEGTGRRGRSLNWAKGHKIFTSAHATQDWSLHFSVVNTAATNAITQNTYRTKGYAGCIANLVWLPKKT